MTKTELIKEIDLINSNVDDLVNTLSDALDTAKSIYRKIEYLPSETDEIEDDEKES